MFNKLRNFFRMETTVAPRVDYTHKTFLQQFKNIVQGEKIVVIFMSSLESNGKYWCPDCESAKYNINNFVLPDCENKGIKTIFVDVGDRKEWRDSKHPLRNYSKFQINGVPTLALFENGKMTKKLVERSIQSEDNVKNFLK